MSQTNLQFAPIESKRTFEEVSLEIKKGIFREKLKPGDRLPSEMELASQFNVGRQTIREALRVLELSGFISIKKGSGGGPVIENTILNRIQSLFFDAFLTEKITRDELQAARNIELVILDHLLEHIDRRDIQSLKRTISQARKHAKVGVHPFKDNAEFHVLLAKATKNQMFIVVIESIMAVVTTFFSRIQPEIEASVRIIDEHEEILDAIIQKDGPRAKTLMHEHLKSIAKNIGTTQVDRL